MVRIKNDYRPINKVTLSVPEEFIWNRMENMHTDVWLKEVHILRWLNTVFDTFVSFTIFSKNPRSLGRQNWQQAN